MFSIFVVTLMIASIAKYKSLFATWAAQNSKSQKQQSETQSKQTGKQTQIKIQSK